MNSKNSPSVLKNMADNSLTDKDTVHSYLETYQEILIKKKETARNILEIGINKGGSIKLWSDFFTNATIYGLDINDTSEVIDSIKNKKNIKLFNHYDAYNFETFYYNFLKKDIKFDLILDDGPHDLNSMRTFIKLYSQVLASDGILIIEDVQSMDWIETLVNEVPDDLIQYIKVYDLRIKKNRYDDILFVIDKCNV
jgi:cephalosporin hydroxylase